MLRLIRLALVAGLALGAIKPSLATEMQLSTSPSEFQSVSASDSQVRFELAIPADVSLGASPVQWHYQPFAELASGERSRDLYGIAMTGLTVDFEGAGRRATVLVRAEWAATAVIVVTADTGAMKLSRVLRATFEPSQARPVLGFADGKDISFEVDAPNPGADLQTTIQVRLTWPTNAAYVSLAPIAGERVPEKYQWTGGGPDGLREIEDGGTGWMPITVSYNSWKNYGSTTKYHWSIRTPNFYYVPFSRDVNVDLGFQALTPEFSVQCPQQSVTSSGSCVVTLLHKDSRGNVVVGPQEYVRAMMNSRIALNEWISSGKTFNVEVPAGAGSSTLALEIREKQVKSVTQIVARDNSAEVGSRLTLSLDCPSLSAVPLGSKIRCIVTSGGVPTSILRADGVILDAQYKSGGKWITWYRNSEWFDIGDYMQLWFPVTQDITAVRASARKYSINSNIVNWRPNTTPVNRSSTNYKTGRLLGIYAAKFGPSGVAASFACSQALAAGIPVARGARPVSPAGRKALATRDGMQGCIDGYNRN